MSAYTLVGVKHARAQYGSPSVSMPLGVSISTVLQITIVLPPSETVKYVHW